MKNKYRFNRSVCLGLVLILGLIAFQGCESMRRKFVRKKKEKQKEEFVPILEPKDYPPRYESSIERYKYHYSLWKVWEKDLREALSDNNEKRKKYLLNEIVTQLTEMRKWLPEEKQKELQMIMAELSEVEKELDKSTVMRNNGQILRALDTLEKKIRNHFSPTMVEAQLVSPSI